MPRLIVATLLATAALWGAVPQPRSFFGHEMGADRTVLDWAKVVSYFRALEQSSNRIRVVELGKSTGGRPFIAAWIASPQTLANLSRYQEIQRRLADPRLTTEAQAQQLAREGKAVVMITCSIHATEIASSHTAVEFAYRLLTEDKPRFRTILDNTVFILVPSLNPDGMDLVTAWYRKTLNTSYEGTSPPELYHKYLGHDNNRDWYIHTQAETKLTVAKLHNVWHPQIVYDVHQQNVTASRIFLPPWLDPIEPNVDAILVQGMNMIGTSMALDLTAAGKTGVAVNAAYDFWTPARSYQSFHGGMRILSESASVRIATPVTLSRSDLDRTAHGYNAQERSWNHIEPWQGGTWRLRDIVDYQMIAYESCLYNAAIHREDLLRNFYRIGRRQVARKAPSAFVIPVRQRDPGATRQLLQILESGMVEIHRAPDGGYVIPMAQPYSGYAKALLEPQHYPDLRQYPGGPPKRPYDVTAHTLPMLMGVKVETAEKVVAGPRVSVSREGPGPSLAGADTDAWYNVNRIWASGKPVWRNMETGDFSAAAQPGWKQINRPRVGLYRSYNPSMDEGWTRWILERFGFVYRSVKNPEILAGNLRAQYDVLVFPDQGMAVIENGYRTGEMPGEYTGGLGRKGADALREFASAGGTLVFLNRSSEYAVERLGVKAQNVVKGAGNSEFYSPGSLLNAIVDTRHPLCLGLPSTITVWSEHSPAWETGEAVVARYPEANLLASGWLLGERYLAKRAAIVDARLGAGHVVLFGLLPQYRAQSYQGFKMFFNALLYR
ncbi:MAG TPA: M14 metallopeptidase family protein [Bryobacteraceae bacterium]|nr:M14 metallopeptidase family protein [Bryobacteraceae bacterium]